MSLIGCPIGYSLLEVGYIVIFRSPVICHFHLCKKKKVGHCPFFSFLADDVHQGAVVSGYAQHVSHCKRSGPVSIEIEFLCGMFPCPDNCICINMGRGSGLGPPIHPTSTDMNRLAGSTVAFHRCDSDKEGVFSPIPISFPEDTTVELSILLETIYYTLLHISLFNVQRFIYQRILFSQIVDSPTGVLTVPKEDRRVHRTPIVSPLFNRNGSARLVLDSLCPLPFRI